MKKAISTIRSQFSLVLAILLVIALLVPGCGKKPQPDPSGNDDVSTGVSQDEDTSSLDDVTGSTYEGDDATDESADVTDESADSTDESTDTAGDSTTNTDTSTDGTNTVSDKDETTKSTETTTTKKGDTTKSTVKTTTNKGDATKSTVKTTTKKGDTTKSTSKTTTKKGDTTKSTSKTTTKTGTSTTRSGITVTKTSTSTTPTATTTAKPIDKTVKDKVLSLFDDSMKGKTATFLIHYVADSDTDKLKQMYEETGVKIKYHIAEYETFGTRLAALINASASPDVAYFRSEQYAPLVNKGYMTDISGVGVDLAMDIYDQELIDLFTWNGKKYGLSTKNSADAVFTILYYNKTIFDRVGATDPGTLWKQGKWNWDTFVTSAMAVNDSANSRWGCEIYDSSIYLCSGGVGVITMGDGFIKNNLTDQRVIDSWTFINKLHHEYKVTTGLAGAEENFSNGKSVMLIGESWMWGKTNVISRTKDEWGVVPAPLAPGIKASAIINPRAACIPIGAKNPKLGLAVYTYWTSNDTYQGKKEEIDTDEYPHLDPEALNNFYSDLWDLPKIVDLSSGIIEYGGEYTRWDFSFDVFQAGMSGINSSIDKWKTAIDVNIKRIMTEFS